MIFAPERMLRMDVLTLCDDVALVTGLLAREGSFHVVERELPIHNTDLEGSAGRSSRGADIDRFSSLAESLMQRLDLRPLDVDIEKQQAFLTESTGDAISEIDDVLSELQSKIDEQLRDRHDVEAAIARLDAMSEQMHLLHDLGLSFLDLQKFKHMYARYGTMDRGHAPRLNERLGNEDCTFVTRPFHGKDAAFLLIGDREQADNFDAMLKDAGARSLRPSDRYLRSFEEGLEQVEIDLWQQRDRLAEINRRFAKLRDGWRENLSALRTRLRVHSMLSEAISRFGSDGTVTLISGFVPVSRQKALLDRLERQASGLYYARLWFAEENCDIPTPTHLCNWRLFRPFELFVKTYGLPGYNEVDPTPFVAISFLAMFGMMFGDVGHGLVLAAIGAGIAFLPYRVFLAVRDLGRILLMAGLSGTLFGFLFGSVFGVERDSVLPALWMRPSHPENLTMFLGVALGFGVFVISTGIALNIVQSLRKRNIRKALIGQWSAASLVFFWGLLVLLGFSLTGKHLPLPTGLMTTVLAMPLFLIVGGQTVFFFLDRHRREKEAERRSLSVDGDTTENAEEEEELVTILFEPIEIVSNLFTNSVSFLRVAAFGLAHAALTMAIFTVNDMVKAPGVAILSLPVEHLFIIVLEGMIVTIQCLRLEYYEFFSKFFNGNGVAYAPLVISNDVSTE